MKIAYFHRLTFDETEQRFSIEAKNLGTELVFIKYKDLQLTSNSDLSLNSITYNGLDIKNFDAWFVRSVGSEFEWSKLLQLYAKEHNIPVVDEYIVTEGVLKRFKSTMGYILASNGINYPNTLYLNTLNQVKEYIKINNSTVQQYNKAKNQPTSQPANFSYPFIIKLSSGGRHGMGTFFIQKPQDIAELEQTLQNRKQLALKEGKQAPIFRGFLIQEYIQNDGDYRVMTVGYKCIGGFKRAPKEIKLVLNKSLDKSKALDAVPQDVVKVAEDAARVLQIEVAGTDLVRDAKTNKVYIVEVNEAPQFKVFEKRTKINAPKAVLEYVMQKARGEG